MKIEIENNSSHSLKPLKIALHRQNIFAGVLATSEDLAPSRGVKFFTPDQKLHLGEKIQGSAWPLAPGKSAALQITIPVDAGLSPSVSRALSWNAYRQYCLVVTATNNDMLNRKTARSATPVMLVHEFDYPKPDPNKQPGTLSVALLGYKRVKKLHQAAGLSLGHSPRGERSNLSAEMEQYEPDAAPSDSFWESLKASLKAEVPNPHDAPRQSRSAPKRLTGSASEAAPVPEDQDSPIFTPPEKRQQRRRSMGPIAPVAAPAPLFPGQRLPSSAKQNPRRNRRSSSGAKNTTVVDTDLLHRSRPMELSSSTSSVGSAGLTPLMSVAATAKPTKM